MIRRTLPLLQLQILFLPSKARPPMAAAISTALLFGLCLSWNPALHGHNKDLRDRQDFGRTSKRCIRLSSYRNPQRQVHRRFSPFHLSDQSFSALAQSSLHLRPFESLWRFMFFLKRASTTLSSLHVLLVKFFPICDCCCIACVRRGRGIISLDVHSVVLVRHLTDLGSAPSAFGFASLGWALGALSKWRALSEATKPAGRHRQAPQVFRNPNYTLACGEEPACEHDGSTSRSKEDS